MDRLTSTDHPNYNTPPTPVCDRCHNLLHHQSGTSIDHPSLQSIKNTISESPYKYNHIYHVIDAADFPLSFIPNLHQHLSLSPQRSQNRRAKTGKFLHGRKAEVSFIITRSDLLAPKKEHVDSLMPYLVQVLRDALGASGKDIRLGNVRCVSSQRGWWTKEVKEDIWRRGGGGWMVGKVNVGKSRLFEAVFPKGRGEDVSRGKLHRHIDPDQHSGLSEFHDNGSSILENNEEKDMPTHEQLAESTNETALLPPSRPETQFPVMPVVSALPGTTASPIRLPFGNGKGELIDLPGLFRGNLENYGRKELKMGLIMQTRVNPKQQVIKPGQSLLLGGLIRITPTRSDLVILAYPFVPIEAHVTSTEKAISVQTQQRISGINVVLGEDVGDKMALAGSFPLRWDVTKIQSGPLTAPAAVGLNAEKLPYKVLSTDILIEGCGWVELVVQVRKSKLDGSPSSSEAARNDGGTESNTSSSSEEDIGQVPGVEVFSPEGKYIGCRRPMNAWLFSNEKSTATNRQKRRPKPSMKRSKKNILLLGRK